LPEREEGTVVVVAAAESRALKQAKKHPIAEVREKDQKTNLGVEPKQQQQQHYSERVIEEDSEQVRERYIFIFIIYYYFYFIS